jgi:NAD(P)H dehydrogenase (quinone)
VGLLATKVALVLNTGNTPLDREREAFGDPLVGMWRDCILRYCGVGEVMRSLFGVVATSSEDERRRWLLEAAALADKAAALAKSA